ncbi:MAG: PBP1A family penicillin-binding protein [Acidobacteriota bacterium]
MKLPRPRHAWDWLAFALVAGLMVGGALSVWWLSRAAIRVHQLTRGLGDTTFYDADGHPWFRLDEQRHDVPLEEIASDLQHAVVAIEDRRFYHHPGIDPIGVTRAVAHNLRFRGRAEGASTLTQQLARTLFLSNTRTLGRKAREAGLALLIEQQLTKSQILSMYLNHVYLSAGVYGVQTMSEHLFRKSAKALTLAEAAMIAGLIRAPSALSPWSNYDGALERSRTVLAVMRREGFITAEQEAAAARARPAIQPYRQGGDSRFAWAKEFLRQQFREQFGGDHPPDWQVHTSFMPEIQDAAERAVTSGLGRLNRPGLQAALVAIDPANGNLLALVGGSDYRKSTYNRATRSRRQPGSAFKPIVYAAALAHGYSPVSVLSNLDAVAGPGDLEWTPQNADHTRPAELTLRAALVESNNAAAVDLQQKIGVRTVLSLATEAGLGDLPEVPSLALGTGIVSPIELTAAYTMFPGGGEMSTPRGIVDVYDANGGHMFEQLVERKRLVSAEVAYQMTSMLQDAIDHGTGAPARTLGVRGPVAGKTGTTDDYHDAWFVGFSSSVVVGVWVGFDQPASIGNEAYGARVALPIWAAFMNRTASRLPAREFAVPESLSIQDLCSVSYLRPVDDCPVYHEYFKEGDAIPSQSCSVHAGSLKQAAGRAVGGFFTSLGRSLAGLFKRHE